MMKSHRISHPIACESGLGAQHKMPKLGRGKQHIEGQENAKRP